jgi:hypothetical protein
MGWLGRQKVWKEDAIFVSMARSELEGAESPAWIIRGCDFCTRW